MLKRFDARFTAWVDRLDWGWLHLWWITLLACFQVTLFLLVVPPWQHYDEPAHFRYAWSRSNLEPNLDNDPYYTPLDPNMVRETLGSMVEHGFYWELPTPNYLRTHSLDNLGHGQSGEFPLYYEYLARPLSLLNHTDITTQLRVGRLLTGLFFLIIVWAGIGTLRCLTPAGHVLRWLVPTCLALMGPLADIATAVNNDASAIAGFSLFLWGAVHGLTRRMTGWHAVGLTLAMLFTVAAKEALIFLVPLLPLAWVLGIWRHRGWAGRWLALGLAAVLLLCGLLLVRMDSAAFWTTRWIPTTPGRALHDQAVHGDHAMPVLVNYETLYQRLPSAWVRDNPERLLNFGAWVWSDEPVSVPVLGFSYVTEDANFMYTEVLVQEDEPREITSEPQFVTEHFWVPKEAVILYVFLWPYTLVAQETGNRVYYDHVVLMEGVVDTEVIPTYVNGNSRHVQWGEREARNLVRNASGEMPWPNFHGWVDEMVEARADWHPTAILHRVLDFQWSGSVLWVRQPRFMLFNLFNRLAWGGVNLPGPFWGHLTLVLAALGILGCGLRGRSLLLGRDGARTAESPATAYVFLLVCLAGVWLGAVLWIVKFMWMDDLHLSDIRYTFPASLIIVGVMAGGMQHLGSRLGLMPRRLPYLIVGVWLLYDLLAAWAYLDAFAF